MEAPARQSLRHVLFFQPYKQRMSYGDSDLEAAYQRACEEGKTEIYLARLNLIGFHEAGKTSLAKRLMGKAFEPVESTEGIALHDVTFPLHDTIQKGRKWEETTITPELLDKITAEKVQTYLAKHENQGFMEIEERSEKEEGEKNEGMEQPHEGDKINDVPHFSSPDVRQEASSSSLDVTPTQSSGHWQREENVATVPVRSGTKDEQNLSETEMDVDRSTPTEVNVARRIRNLKKHVDSPFDQSMKFTLRLWDLGGQNDFLPTHHLFLDVEATTVIVMDITKEFEKTFEIRQKNLMIKSNNPGSPVDILHYWLNSFYEKTKEKEARRRRIVSPNLFIVLTHIDEIPENVREAQIQNYKDKIINSVQLKHRCIFKEDNMFTVDNKTGREEMFEDLRQKLYDSFKEQESWGQDMPTKWLQLQSEVLEKERKYLNRYELLNMAESIGMSDKEVTAFLNIHNQVGTFLYFGEISDNEGSTSRDLLRDIVFTDPQWLIDMCKTVITHPEFLRRRKGRYPIAAIENLSKGFVTEADLEALWAGEAAFLTNLMQKFDLFVPMASTGPSELQYLIPCMLPEQGAQLVRQRPEQREILYSALHKPKGHHWSPVGTFEKYLAALIKDSVKCNWKLARSPFPSYGCISFLGDCDLSLKLLTEDSCHFKAVIHCKKSLMKDKKRQTNMAEILRATKECINNTLEDVDTEEPQDVTVLCPYYGLRGKGLELILTAEGLTSSDVICPCHCASQSKADYEQFLDQVECKCQSCLC